MTKTIELFNGRDLTGWEDHKNPHLWTVVDGMIVGTSEAGKLAECRARGGNPPVNMNHGPDVSRVAFLPASTTRSPCASTTMSSTA